MEDLTKITEIELPMNAARTCFAIGRIGYSPAEAICDIVDNSVTNGARNCRIWILKIDENILDQRKDNIKEVIIADDGIGMDRDTLLNALSLGSNDEAYRDRSDSLSKFGMGLKSAGISLGNCLEVITKKDGIVLKAILDITKITDKYKVFMPEVEEEDIKLLEENGINNSGTIVRISNIYTKTHPSIKNICDELKSGQNSLGTVYYYFIEDGINLFLQGEKIESIDVLFENEANDNGDLDEDSWDGLSVRWIQKPNKLVISAEEGISVTISATQMVHANSVRLKDGKEAATLAENKYGLKAGNYGFYIYRNNRLISWADPLKTSSQARIVAMHPSNYCFRGKILINSESDDYFNIDVKKKNIELSEEAYDAIYKATYGFVKKSRDAFDQARKHIEEVTSEDSTARTEEILEGNDQDINLVCEPVPTGESDKSRSERKGEIERESQKEIIEETKQRIKAENPEQEDFPDDIIEKEKEVTAKGEAGSTNSKIYKVPTLPDGELYKRYLNADSSVSVRINMSHRFARLIYEENRNNIDLQVIFELMLFKLVETEYRLIVGRESDSSSDKKKLENTLALYKETFSELMSKLCRDHAEILPPKRD